jgi:RNA polymerase sigma factor (sigma-70 family)
MSAIPVMSRPGLIRRPTSTPADPVLVKRVQRGHEQSFEAIFTRHYAPLLSYCRHILGNRDEAEDALQQTFIKAHRALVTKDPPNELRPWLYAIARNCCLSAIAERKPTSDLDDHTPSLAGLSEQVHQREDLREMVAALGRLPEAQRSALLLAELEDLSHQEIATILECPVSKVKALVYQARTSLITEREALKAPCHEIREQLSVARGSELRRGSLRRHLKLCSGCRDFQQVVSVQRQSLAAVLPVLPTAALAARVLTHVASHAVASGGVSGAGASLAPSGAAGAGSAVSGAAGVASTGTAGSIASAGAASGTSAGALVGGGLVTKLALGGTVAALATAGAVTVQHRVAHAKTTHSHHSVTDRGHRLSNSPPPRSNAGLTTPVDYQSGVSGSQAEPLSAAVVPVGSTTAPTNLTAPGSTTPLLAAIAPSTSAGATSAASTPVASGPPSTSPGPVVSNHGHKGVRELAKRRAENQLRRARLRRARLRAAARRRRLQAAARRRRLREARLLRQAEARRLRQQRIAERKARASEPKNQTSASSTTPPPRSATRRTKAPATGSPSGSAITPTSTTSTGPVKHTKKQAPTSSSTGQGSAFGPDPQTTGSGAEPEVNPEPNGGSTSATGSGSRGTEHEEPPAGSGSKAGQEEAPTTKPGGSKAKHRKRATSEISY